MEHGFLVMYQIYTSNDIHNPSGYALGIMNIIFGVYLIHHLKPCSIHYIYSTVKLLILEIITEWNEKTLILIPANIYNQSCGRIQ